MSLIETLRKRLVRASETLEGEAGVFQGLAGYTSSVSNKYQELNVGNDE